MSGKTLNEKGELLVTTTDTSTIEYNQISIKETLYLLLVEARKTNLYLSALSGEEVRTKDVIGGHDEI